MGIGGNAARHPWPRPCKQQQDTGSARPTEPASQRSHGTAGARDTTGGPWAVDWGELRGDCVTLSIKGEDTHAFGDSTPRCAPKETHTPERSRQHHSPQPPRAENQMSTHIRIVTVRSPRRRRAAARTHEPVFTRQLGGNSRLSNGAGRQGAHGHTLHESVYELLR